MAKAKSTSKKVATEASKVLRDDQFSETSTSAPAIPTSPGRAAMTPAEHCVCHVLGREGCSQHSYAALEAAAVATGVRLRAAVEGLPRYMGTIEHPFGAAVQRSAVLALLDEQP